MSLAHSSLVVALFCVMQGITYALEKKEVNIISYLEGSWRSRTIDNFGKDINDPRFVKYVRSTSEGALYGDVGQASRVIKKDAQTGLLLMVEVIFSKGKPMTSSLIGKYDSNRQWIEWYVGNVKGARKLIWRLESENRFAIEMDADWVKERRKELEKSLIPRDHSSGPDLVYVMERITSE